MPEGTRRVGSGGFEVAAVGLGWVPVAAAPDPPGPAPARDDDAVATVRAAAGLGAPVLLATSDLHGPYTGELLLGRALAGVRDRFVLSTTCGLVVQGARTVRDGRPEQVRRACDASLRRLQADEIDLYQLHSPDPEVPLEETWGAMEGWSRTARCAPWLSATRPWSSSPACRRCSR